MLRVWCFSPNYPLGGLTVSVFAQKLAQCFQITEQDLLIGHSTGGWVALHIKQLVNSPVVQIASWTDRRTVVAPLANRHLIYLGARLGLYKGLLLVLGDKIRPSDKCFYHE